MPEVEAKAPEKSEPARNSPMFKLGLLFSQMAQLLDRAIDGVKKIKIRKPNSKAP